MIDPQTTQIQIGSRTYQYKPAFINRFPTEDRHEPWLDRAYASALATRKGVFLDVGANRGQTLVTLLALDPDRPWVGFEPQLDCCAFLQDFIRRNRLASHQVIPLALSDTEGTTSLLKRFAQADGTASTVKGFRPDDFYRFRQTVLSVRGDEVLDKLDTGSIAILKVDVEGGELEVCQGFQRMLGRDRPIVFFEVLNHFLMVTKQTLDNPTIAFREQRQSKLEALLRTLDYRIYNVKPNGRVSPVERITPGSQSTLEDTAYVAVQAGDETSFVHHVNAQE